MTTIRAAITEDADALARISAAAYGQYIAVMGGKPAPMLADYAGHLARDTVFVATDGADITGYAIITEKADGFWLENIAVAPDAGGRGIGTALIGHVEAYLASCTDRYRLYTNEKMARNIDWYLRLGFNETGRRIQDGYARVFFEKRLPQTPR